MNLTRHLVVFCALLCVSLVLIGVFVGIVKQPEEISSSTDISFVTPQGSYGVFHEDSGGEEERLTFIEKVRNALQVDPQQAPSQNEVVIEIPKDAENAYQSYVRPFVSPGPQKGALFACTLSTYDVPVPHETPWIIDDSQWDPTQKRVVAGSVQEFGLMSVAVESGTRVIRTQGVPAHQRGVFPVTADDPTYPYGVNTYSMHVHNFVLTVSTTPSIAPAPSCIAGDVVGVLNSGALLYRGITHGGADARLTSLTDSCGGHVDTLGRYHYHEGSDCVQSENSGILGYALDGFGIFGSVEEGAEVTNADLDVCHGHSHAIIWDGKVVEMYHYHLTDEFPYSIGCFMGTPQPLLAN